MRALAALALLTLACGGVPQGSSAAERPMDLYARPHYYTGPPESTRMQTIWQSVIQRIELQNDVWFDDGDFPRCIQALRLANNMRPANYDLATSLGWLLESTEQDDEALATYVRYKKQNPGDPDNSYPEANYYFQKRAYAKVPGLLEPAIKRVPAPHPNAFRTLAHAYERIGLLEDSRRVWSSLVRLTPQDGAAKNNLKRVETKIKGGAKPNVPAKGGARR